MSDLQRIQAGCYNAYRHAVDRCSNPKDKEYNRYGSRGISMGWTDYKSFKNDMYDSYVEHLLNNPGVRNTQLDRINNDGNYSKSNCRWVTAKENGRNKRNNRIIRYEGVEYCLKEFCEVYNLPYKNTWKRLFVRNWPIEKII